MLAHQLENIKGNSEDAILARARRYIGNWVAYWGDNNASATFDSTFALGQQWTAAEMREYDQELQKPRLTFNKVYLFVRQLLSEQRDMTPQVKVRALNGDVPQDALDLRADILRHIAYSSKTRIVYQNAFQWSLLGGFGAIRIATDYESEMSLNQIIKVESVLDPRMTFFDPSAKETTKSDGRYCGEYIFVSRDEFNELYPDIPYPSSFAINGSPFYWGDTKQIAICDYYERQYEDITIALLNNGKSMPLKDAKKLIKEQEEERSLMSVIPMEQTLEIVKTRKSKKTKIMHYRLIKDRILEESEFPGKYLPLIFVDGDSFIVDNRQRTHSFIRFAVDSQRFVNYCGSAMAEFIKKSRKELFLATPDHIKGFEQDWRSPETVRTVLLYHRQSNPADRPEPIRPLDMPSGLINQYVQSTQDIQEILGRHEANLGMQGNEQSGVAIARRAAQGNKSAFVYFDNLNRAVEQVGRTILHMIPIVYDTERTIITQSADGKQKAVTINQLELGQYKNDMSQGEYDIEITAGASFELQKAEAMQQLAQLFSIPPNFLTLIGDLWAANVDLPNTNQIVERLKTVVSPQILAKENGEPPPPQPPDPQAMMAQQQMQLQQKSMAIKEQELQLEQAKLALQREQMVADQHIAEIKAQAETVKAITDRQKAQNGAINHLRQQTIF